MSIEDDQDRAKLAIWIDDKEYEPSAKELTGTQLRDLVKPPVPADRDLWLEVPDGHDKLIESTDVVELRNNMRFFTAPAKINPGWDAQSR